MTRAYCERCGAPFYREDHETWKKMCLGCWKRQKAYESKFTAPSETTLLRDRVKRLELEVENLRGQNALLKMWLSESEENYQQNSMDSLLDKHIRFLIFACHPDRNGGSAEASEVTRMLLDLRNEKTRVGGAGE